MIYELQQYQSAYALVNTLVSISSFSPASCPEASSLIVETIDLGQRYVDRLMCELNLISDNDGVSRFLEDEEYRNNVLMTYAENTEDNNVLEKFTDSLKSPKDPKDITRRNGFPSPATPEDGPLLASGVVNYCIGYRVLDLLKIVREKFKTLHEIDAESRLSTIEKRLSTWAEDIIETQILSPLKEMNETEPYMGKFNRFLSDKEYRIKVLIEVGEANSKQWDLFVSLTYNVQ